MPNLINILTLAALLLLSSCATIHHNLAGRVFDCGTHQPIAGARVEVHEIDWGMREGGVVWDKDFIESALTDVQGHYRIQYSHLSSAKVLVRKDGYRITQHFTGPSDHVDMGLLAGPATEWTEQCKPLKDCLHTTIENGVQVTRDVCED
jgi:hypothetical protein